MTQVPAHNEIQSIRSRLRTIHPVIEIFLTDLLIHFSAFLMLKYPMVRSAFDVFSSSPGQSDLSMFGNRMST